MRRRYCSEENLLKVIGQIGNAQAVQALIQALSHEDSDVRYRAAKALGQIGTLKTLERLIQNTKIDIFDADIFILARKLAIRFSKEKTPFIPVYPELIGREAESVKRET